MTFQEYPKVMHHPQHQAAEYRQLPGKGKGLFAPDTVMTKAERLPDVTVTNRKDEEYYAARGYRPNNMGDESEYEAAIMDAQPEGAGGFQEYPKWKYHATEIPLVVKNAKEEAALGTGWHDQPVFATEEDLQPAAPAPEPVKRRGGRQKKAVAA